MAPCFEDTREFKPLSANHVGTLYELNARLREPRVRNVFADQELIIGRNPNKWCVTLKSTPMNDAANPVRSELVVDDPLVSNKHIRIYTIIFDQDNPEVAPLVYAQDLSLNGVYWNGHRIDKRNGGYLLNGGDILQVTHDISFQFRCGSLPRNPFCGTQAEEMEYFESKYAVTHRELGSGTYGHVHLAIDKEKKIQLACKIVDLTSLRRGLWAQESSKGDSHEGSGPPGRNQDICLQQRVESKLKTYDREVEILQKLRHPNIIGIEKVFKTENTMYIFQDLAAAGDLFSFLEFKRRRLLDIEAAVIVRQIVIALDYLHGQNIVHRDLKPDNVLMTSLSAGCRVILTDFGCSREIKPQKTRMASIMGTFEYTAPEISRGKLQPHNIGYTKSVDLWSLGCLTVVLLTGGSPFSDSKTGKYSETLARQCDLQALEKDEDWKSVGKRAKNFVRRLLVLEEDKRLTAKEAYGHHWFTNPAHKHAFAEVYKRAIQGWRPRPQSCHVLYDLRRNRLTEGSSLWRDGYGKSEVALSNTPKCRGIPITLPDPGLQKLSPPNKCENLNKGGTSDCRASINPRAQGRLSEESAAAPGEVHQGETNTSKTRKHDGQGLRNTKLGFRTPFSPEAWRKELKDPKIAERPIVKDINDKKENEISLEALMLPPPLYALPGPPPCQALSKDKKLGQKHVSFRGSNRPKRTPRDIYDFEEDEVFEMVEDSVTGKRRKIRYGEV